MYNILGITDEIQYCNHCNTCVLIFIIVSIVEVGRKWGSVGEILITMFSSNLVLYLYYNNFQVNWKV